MSDFDKQYIIGEFKQDQGHLHFSNNFPYNGLYLSISKNILPFIIVKNYLSSNNQIDFKVIEEPTSATRKIIYGEKVYNVVEEWNLNKFFNSRFGSTVNIYKKIQSYPEFEECANKDEEINKEIQQVKEYLKELIESSGYDENTLDSDISELYRKTAELREEYGSKLYYNFKRDYLSYSDSAVKDLTMVNNLRYFNWVNYGDESYNKKFMNYRVLTRIFQERTASEKY